MSKKRVFILVLISLLVLGVAGGTYWYLNREQIALDKIKSKYGGDIAPSQAPPEELSTNFDPTQNAPMFKIESVNVDERTLNLEIVYPRSWEGKKVISQITCQEGDIKIVTNLGLVPRNVTLDALIDKAQKTSKENMILSGICADNECRQIYKSCELYLN